MAWTSRGLRGSTLEEMINRTNEQYRDKHLALIQKVPTPITPIKIDKESRHITLAYFEKKSTVDYIGAVGSDEPEIRCTMVGASGVTITIRHAVTLKQKM